MSEYVAPMRYPGGKKWIVNYVELFLKPNRRPELFLEPYAGGAAVGLSLLARDCFDHLQITELDPSVACFWRTALNDPSLAEWVNDFDCNHDNVNAVLDDTSPANWAKWIYVKNRVSRNGYLHKGGRNTDVAARWCKRTTVPALRRIHTMRGRITLVEGDALDSLQAHNSPKNACFVDPPYCEKGRQMYQHWEVDYDALFALLQQWRGPWLTTIDNHKTIRGLIRRYDLTARHVSMVTGHAVRKRELVVSNMGGLDWLPCRKILLAA